MYFVKVFRLFDEFTKIFLEIRLGFFFFFFGFSVGFGAVSRYFLVAFL